MCAAYEKAGASRFTRRADACRVIAITKNVDVAVVNLQQAFSRHGTSYTTTATGRTSSTDSRHNGRHVVAIRPTGRPVTSRDTHGRACA